MGSKVQIHITYLEAMRLQGGAFLEMSVPLTIPWDCIPADTPLHEAVRVSCMIHSGLQQPIKIGDFNHPMKVQCALPSCHCSSFFSACCLEGSTLGFGGVFQTGLVSSLQVLCFPSEGDSSTSPDAACVVVLCLQVLFVELGRATFVGYPDPSDPDSWPNTSFLASFQVLKSTQPR